MRRLLATLAALALLAAPARADRWKPVDPADLALTSCSFEPSADAEALFWEVSIEDLATDGEIRTVLDHYLRVKVFNDRGVTAHGTVEIPYATGTRIFDVQGRTIQPDGTTLSLDGKAIFDRVTVKAGRLKVKTKSFAMPGVKPGVVLEYRYREIRGDAIAHYLRLDLQRDIPVKSVSYSIKPLDAPGYVMRCRTFHGEPAVFVPGDRGFHRTSQTEVRSYREEPYMPPDSHVRRWMLIYYSPQRDVKPDAFWADYAKSSYEAFKPETKVTSEIRRAADEAIAGAADEEDQLRRLYAWCRSHIRNTSNKAEHLSAEERESLAPNKHPADALKRGIGSGYDIDMLFAALCAAAGLESRVARLADRSDLFFDPAFADGYFLRTYDIAVKVGDQWRFFDPGSPTVPYGRLRWQEEGVQALICGPGAPQWVETPMSSPADSRTSRVGRFRLEANGDLEGEVRVEYTGHEAVEERDDWLDEVPEKREAALRDRVLASLGAAELSAIAFENGTDHDRPFACRYHVRAPGFALRTGRRLVLQPGYFQHGKQPLFAASERLHPVYLPFGWTSLDSVMITLPEGWEIEGGESPPRASAEGVCRYEATVGMSGDGRLLVWTRDFEFGTGGNLWFAHDQYPALKRLFDVIATRDQHAVTLKPAAAAAE
jgi:hypothetical protein